MATADVTRFPVVPGTPSHYRAGSDENHFEGYCDECDAHYSLRWTMADAEDRYYSGRIGQDMWEAFMHTWALSGTRSARWDAWAMPPVTERARAIANLIRLLHRESVGCWHVVTLGEYVPGMPLALMTRGEAYRLVELYTYAWGEPTARVIDTRTGLEA
jgi:hypothetical protein